MVDIFYGGIFLVNTAKRETKYIWGANVEVGIDIDRFFLSELVRSLKDMFGNMEIIKLHFRKPKKPLSYSLMFLCEETTITFIELVKEFKRI